MNLQHFLAYTSKTQGPSGIGPTRGFPQQRFTITDDTVGKTMMPKYFTHNNSSGFFTMISLVQGTKPAILVYRSTTVKIVLKPLESGRSVIKSREIDFHSLLGIGNGSNCTNHMDGVMASSIYNMYHMSEHSLRQMFAYEATKIIVLLNPMFEYSQNVPLCMFHGNYVLFEGGMNHWGHTNIS